MALMAWEPLRNFSEIDGKRPPEALLPARARSWIRGAELGCGSAGLRGVELSCWGRRVDVSVGGLSPEVGLSGCVGPCCRGSSAIGLGYVSLLWARIECFRV